MADHCPYCGVVGPQHLRCPDQGTADDCPQAPGHVIRTGPLKGLRTAHYGLIEADPPWSFKTYSKPIEGTVPHRTAEAPYRSMTAEELLALPVSDVAAKDCLLHMWVISSHVEQALVLGAVWGFRFKTLGFNWMKTQKHAPEKPKMGMGKWLRQESEIGLIFTRGKPKRVSAGVRQAIMEPARQHSRKPDVRLERLEALVDGPYLEMFSRSSREGWDTMGDEAGKFDPLDLSGLDAEARALI